MASFDVATMLSGKAPELSGRQKAGRALSAISAGLMGQGPQYLQQIQQQDMQSQQQAQQLSAERLKAMAIDAQRVNQLLSSGDIQGALRVVDNRTMAIKQLGGDPKDTLRIRALITAGEIPAAQAEIGGFLNAAQQYGIIEAPKPQIIPQGSISPSGQIAMMGANGQVSTQSIPGYTAQDTQMPASYRALEMRAEASGLTPGTPEYQDFMRSGGNPLRAGQASAVTRTYDNGTVQQVLPDGSIHVFDPSGREVTGEERVQTLRAARQEQVEMAAAKTGATARTQGSEERLQNTIDEGLDAAQGVSTLYRALDLLDEVDTGGWDAVRVKAKQAFGVESADEGELASSLGKAVLSQLRSTFGAAFTEREGARLEGIEARMGANTETNKRLLKQTLSIVERAANRAIDAAYEIGDERTARDIEDLLDFRLNDEGGAAAAPELSPGAIAAGVTPEEWAQLTPDERALF